MLAIRPLRIAKARDLLELNFAGDIAAREPAASNVHPYAVEIQRQVRRRNQGEALPASCDGLITRAFELRVPVSRFLDLLQVAFGGES